MSTKKVLKLYSLGLIVLLVGVGVILTAWIASVQAGRVERRQVLLTTTLKIGAQEEKFKAFYLSAPADGFDINFNVSQGSIKFSAWQASFFEEANGHPYFEYSNGTIVEKRQTWFYDANNGTAGYGTAGYYGESENEIWYIHFFNEDSYEKEVYIQVVKVWHGLF